MDPEKEANIASVREAIQKSLSQSSKLDSGYALLDTLQADQYDLKRKHAVIDGIIQDINERKKYAGLIYYMIVGWLAVILILLFLYGFKLMAFSDAVLITLITTTTANITVFFLGVVRYLFPNQFFKEIDRDEKS